MTFQWVVLGSLTLIPLSSSQFNLLPSKPSCSEPFILKGGFIAFLLWRRNSWNPKAPSRLSHIEDQGNALILKAKQLKQDPVLLNLGPAPSSLCHTASPCQPFPNQIVDS